MDPNLLKHLAEQGGFTFKMFCSFGGKTNCLNEAIGEQGVDIGDGIMSLPICQVHKDRLDSMHADTV